MPRKRIDENKLQKQVDYLDAHPSCHLSFTGVLHYKRGKFVPNINASYLFNTPGKTPFDHILYRNVIFSPSVCFRHSAYRQYCNIQDYIDLQFRTFDYPVWLTLIANGELHYLPENTAVYRISGTSISNNKNLKKKLNHKQKLKKKQNQFKNKNLKKTINHNKRLNQKKKLNLLLKKNQKKKLNLLLKLLKK